MKKNLKLLLCLIPLLLYGGILSAQHVVTGRVTDVLSGDPLVGATIRESGGSATTVTDNTGSFRISLTSAESVVDVTYVGYEPFQIAISGRNQVEITLTPSGAALDEVVVVGYGTQKKVDLTGAVAIVETENLTKSPNPNPIKAMQGMTPGVSIQTDGNPAGGATVRIRGVSTLNNSDPLYIIDGIPTKASAFNILNSNDIESIQILKDGASAAIYGSRASNGVIIVTTKQAKAETTRVDYSSALTFSKYQSMPDMLNTMERARVQWQATIYDGGNPDNIPFVNYDWSRDANGKATLQGIEIPEYIIPGVRSANTNWFDAISRNGLVQEHNLSISTGGKNSGSVVSLRYYDDKYVLHAKNNKRLTARVNTYQNLFNDVVKIGQNLAVSNVRDNGFSGTLPLERALSVRPILPIFNDDGYYSGPVTGAFTDDKNPYMILDINEWDQRNNVNIFGNIYTDVKITNGLIFRANLGLDWEKGLNRDIERIFDTGIKKRLTNSIRNINSESLNWIANATLNYKYESGNHNLNILGGTEFIENRYQMSSAYREDFSLETLDYFVENAGSGKQIVGGSKTGFNLVSFFGRADYSFNNRYLFAATARYDGSSRFGDNNRFGFFPSFSAGWRIDKEDFMRDVSAINELKLRSSWGVTGNQEISNTAIYTTYITHYGEAEIAFQSDNGTAYDITGADGGSLPSGYRKSQTGNPNLKWEESREVNFGLDYGLWGNKIFGSVDYFIKNTHDILISPVYLAAIGEGGNRFINGAAMKTTGFEVLLGYKDRFGDLGLAVTGNIGNYKDRITDLPDDVVSSYPGNVEQNILGRSMHSIFGYVTDGIFKTQEEVQQHAEQPGKKVGRLRYVDLNDDGVINTLDQRYLGVSSPRLEFGLNLNLDYKRFDVSLFFQGVGLRDVNNTFKRRTDFASLWAGINYGQRILDAWSEDNPNSTIPAATLVDSNNEGRLSTYYIESGAYVKLRQASVGYTIDGVRFIKNIRFYVTGDNLITIKAKSFTAKDPENPYNGFPRPRNVTAGLNLTF